MNVFGFGFLILASLLGGLIAVLADNLGRTLGKKRLSIMKMRPRKTAQVFTFGAGALIPLLSVGAVFILSADVRRWFAEGPRVVEERDRLSNEVKALDLARDRLDGEIQRLQASAKGLSTEVASLKTELATNQKKLVENEKLLSSSQRRVAEGQARVRALDRRIDTLDRQIELTAKQLEDTKGSLLTITLQRDELRTELGRLETSRDYVINERDDAYDELREADAENQRLTNINAELIRSNSDLESQIEQTKQSLAQVQREKQEAEQEREEANIEIDGLRGAIQSAQEQLQQILRLSRDISGGSRTQPVMYRMGEEITRIQIPANLSSDAAANELSRLLRAARAEAEDRGAKPYGNNASADIVERVIDGVTVSPEEQIQRIVRRLSGLSDPLVLVATSSLNAFVGEPVSVEIQSFRNPIVFEAGTMVAEGRIEGDRPEEIIIAQITEFVTRQIRDLARSKGMVPTLGQEERYGLLPQNTLIELMRSARANDRRVRIQAFAPRDIRAGDPLTLDFRIR